MKIAQTGMCEPRSRSTAVDLEREGRPNLLSGRLLGKPPTGYCGFDGATEQGRASQDFEVRCAALRGDVECEGDIATSVTVEQVRKEFGDEVARCVDGVTCSSSAML